MGSSHVSRVSGTASALSAGEKLMLFLVLLCNSDGSQQATSTDEPNTNLSLGQDNQRSLEFAITSTATRVRFRRPA
jgi:hypothetical protein